MTLSQTGPAAGVLRDCEAGICVINEFFTVYEVYCLKSELCASATQDLVRCDEAGRVSSAV